MLKIYDCLTGKQLPLQKMKNRKRIGKKSDNKSRGYLFLLAIPEGSKHGTGPIPNANKSNTGNKSILKQ